MSIQAPLSPLNAVDLFLSNNKQFIGELTKNDVENERQFLEQYHSNPKPTFLSEGNQVLYMAKLRYELFEITRDAFEGVKKALKARETGAFINCSGTFETGKPKSLPLYRELTKRMFIAILKIKADFIDEGPLREDIEELPFPGECEAKNNETYCVASWNEEEDQILRCALGVEEAVDSHEDAQEWNAQRKRGEYTDTSFVVEGKVFHAHKAILTKNQYFSHLLEGFFKESSSQEKTSAPISIKETQPELFETLLTYLYTEKVSLSGQTIGNLIDLSLLADRMVVDNLKRLCNLQLISLLSLENFYEIAHHACLTNDEELLTTCAFFLQNNATEFASIDQSDLPEAAIRAFSRVSQKLLTLLPPPSHPRLEVQKFYLLR